MSTVRLHESSATLYILVCVLLLFFFLFQKVVFRLLTVACVEVEICVGQKVGKMAQCVLFIVGLINSLKLSQNPLSYNYWCLSILTSDADHLFVSCDCKITRILLSRGMRFPTINVAL